MNLIQTRTARIGTFLFAGALLLTGCTQAGATNEGEQNTESTQAAASTQAQALEVTDSWAKAADSGMSAAFGTLRNTSANPLELVSVSDQTHGTELQIHEMAGTGEAMVMQQMGEPLLIPAQGEVELSPGGHHIMYMGLSEPLVPAETSTLTLTFADGSSTDVDFAIRNYDGANESYHEESETEDEHGGH